MSIHIHKHLMLPIPTQILHLNVVKKSLLFFLRMNKRIIIQNMLPTNSQLVAILIF